MKGRGIGGGLGGGVNVKGSRVGRIKSTRVLRAEKRPMWEGRRKGRHGEAGGT